MSGVMKGGFMVKINVSKGFEVGPYHYSLECGPEYDEDLDGRVLWGECSQYRRCIRVKSGLPQQQFRATLLHEIVEAVNDVYLSRALSHEEVSAIGNGLSQVFKGLGVEFVIDGQKGQEIRS